MKAFIVLDKNGDYIKVAEERPIDSISLTNTAALSRFYDKDDLLVLLKRYGEACMKIKRRKVILYKWRLFDKVSQTPVSDIFVVDRADNKRRSVKELKEEISRRAGIPLNKHMTIAGYEPFKDYPDEYGAKS